MSATITTTAIRQREGWGVECPEHPTAYRAGLTERHALNAVAKHNRDHHAEASFNVAAAAKAVLLVAEAAPAYPGALRVWAALLGLPNHEAEEMLEEYAGAEPPIMVVAPPF